MSFSPEFLSSASRQRLPYFFAIIEGNFHFLAASVIVLLFSSLIQAGLLSESRLSLLGSLPVRGCSRFAWFMLCGGKDLDLGFEQ